MSSAYNKQGKNKRETEKISEMLKELSKDIEDKNVKKLLDKIRESMKKLSEKNNKLMNDMKSQQNSSSGKKSSSEKNEKSDENMQKQSNSIKEELNKMAEDLDSLLSKMASKEYSVFEKKLNEIISGLMVLHNRNYNFKIKNTEIVKKLNNIFIGEKKKYNFLTDSIEEYNNYVYILTNRYFYLTSKSFVFPAELVENFKIISDEYNLMKKRLALKQYSQTLVMIRRVLKKNSVLIYKLMKIKDELENESNKKKSQSLSEKLDQLAKAQQMLNSMSFNMSGMSQPQLDQLAYEQSMIRKSLEQMMNRNSNGSDWIQKKLNELVKEMNKVEKQLRKGKMDNKLKNKQKKIYNKLIDASRSLKKDQTDRKKRESKSADKKYKKKPKIKDNNSIYDNLPEELKNYFNNDIPEEFNKNIKEYFNQLIELYR